MTRLGYGCTADPTEAWALSLAARYFDTDIYSMEWFQRDPFNQLVGLRRAAHLVSELSIHEIGQMTGNPEVETPKIRANVERIHAEAARADSSQVAKALRALANRNPTAPDIAPLAASGEPLGIPGFQPLWEARPLALVPPEQPWFVALLGPLEVEAGADPKVAGERALQQALLSIPESDEERRRLSALRRLVIARLFYGVDREADPAAALAWAMINDDLEESLLAIDFLAQRLNAEQIAAADELYGRIREKLDEAEEDWW
jgi:hypothetical protein